MVERVPIRGESIRLGQLLKLVGIVDSGSEVKALLTERSVLVNGEQEIRRGRQLHDGDTVKIEESEFQVSTSDDADAQPD
jgi:ribosome-associated protein